MAGTKRSFDNYLKSGLWKCDKSPIGAHHWIAETYKGGYGEFKCKWCLEVRWFPTSARYYPAIGQRKDKFGKFMEG